MVTLIVIAAVFLAGVLVGYVLRTPEPPSAGTVRDAWRQSERERRR